MEAVGVECTEAGRAGAADTLPKRKALPSRPRKDLLTNSSCSAR